MPTAYKMFINILQGSTTVKQLYEYQRGCDSLTFAAQTSSKQSQNRCQLLFLMKIAINNSFQFQPTRAGNQLIILVTSQLHLQFH